MEIRKYSTPVNFIIFQVCWFACVMGAANNLGWLGPLLVLITVPLQIHLLTENHRAEILFVIICGISGSLLETLMIVANVYTPVDQGWGQVCPPWMAALWFNFALACQHQPGLAQRQICSGDHTGRTCRTGCLLGRRKIGGTHSCRDVQQGLRDTCCYVGPGPAAACLSARQADRCQAGRELKISCTPC